jgi:hypothetical protein
MEPNQINPIAGSYKFLEWVDLENNGVVVECAILKRFPNGDIAFFPLSALDMIDKQRLRNILIHRSVSMYNELWSLLEQQTLGNGMNALLYFNQLAKIRTVNGQLFPFGGGQRSAPAYPQPVETQSQSFEAMAKQQKATVSK